MGEEERRIKMAVIAGASHAIRYKEKNPRANEAGVIGAVTKEVDEILKRIDKEI